jgi:hypothetical protein
MGDAALLIERSFVPMAEKASTDPFPYEIRDAGKAGIRCASHECQRSAVSGRGYLGLIITRSRAFTSSLTLA